MKLNESRPTQYDCLDAKLGHKVITNRVRVRVRVKLHKPMPFSRSVCRRRSPKSRWRSGFSGFIGSCVVRASVCVCWIWVDGTDVINEPWKSKQPTERGQDAAEGSVQKKHTASTFTFGEELAGGGRFWTENPELQQAQNCLKTWPKHIKCLCVCVCVCVCVCKDTINIIRT